MDGDLADGCRGDYYRLGIASATDICLCRIDVGTLNLSKCLSHLVLAEEVLFPEREQEDVSAVGRMFEADVLCSVLQHSRSLVDDPVRAEE